MNLPAVAGLPQKENESTRASLELLYHVSREFTTALDLHTVLERVLFLSMKNVGAISGSVMVLDDNGKPVDSAIITGEQIHKNTTQRLHITLDRGLAGWVARHKQAALIPDTSRDERWLLQKYENEELPSPKSAVSAPLLVRERLIGVMTLVHPSQGFFNEDHLSLVQAIADQAGIAVLNARLYQESQRQARVMTALAESSATITGSINLEEVLNHILEKTSQALSVQAVSLALIDAESGDLMVRAAAGWERQDFSGVRIKIGQGIAGWAAREGRGAVVFDVSQDARFDPEINRRTGLITLAQACAPIRYHGQIIGVLEAINPLDEHFDQDALLVLTGIGSLAGTAIRHAQLFEMLQAAHQRYRELFEDSIDPIFITDWNCKIVEANRQAELASKYDKKTLLSLKISQLHTIDQEKTGENFEKLTVDQTISYESRLRTRASEDVPVQLYVRPVKIENVLHIQWILQDITERKNLDTLREDLLSMIYHDLRSPLANVVSSLDVLDTLAPDDDPTLKSLVGIAQRSTERIQRLTNSLLDVTRLEAGQPITSRQPTAPIQIILEAIEILNPVAEHKQQKIEKILPERLPELMLDEDMIRRVIINLVENAIKYTPPGSIIQVGAQASKNEVQIWVKDNGPGIPEKEQQRIFDKFTRLTNRESSKGLGLGLAYCRLAVEAHDGRIWVESEPGQGARFIFSIPILIVES